MAPSVRDAALDSLIAGARGGDRAAAEGLLERIQPDIFRICWSVHASHDVAEDSCQESLTAIFVGIRRLRRIAGFWGWAAKIARRTAMRHARRQARRREVSNPGALAEAHGGASAVARRSALLAEVASALPQLRPEFKELVELRGIQGWDYDSIATRLEITPANARQRYSRAVDELRRLLRSAHE